MATRSCPQAASAPPEAFRESRRFNLIAFLALAGVILLMRQAEVPRGKLDQVVLCGRTLPGLCLTYRVTGRPCCGCGLTRAVVLAFDGRFDESRRAHRGGVWAAGWLIAQMIARLALAGLRARVEPWKDVLVSGTALFAAIVGPLMAVRL